MTTDFEDDEDDEDVFLQPVKPISRILDGLFPECEDPLLEKVSTSLNKTGQSLHRDYFANSLTAITTVFKTKPTIYGNSAERTVWLLVHEIINSLFYKTQLLIQLTSYKQLIFLCEALSLQTVPGEPKAALAAKVCEKCRSLPPEAPQPNSVAPYLVMPYDLLSEALPVAVSLGSLETVKRLLWDIHLYACANTSNHFNYFAVDATDSLAIAMLANHNEILDALKSSACCCCTRKLLCKIADSPDALRAFIPYCNDNSEITELLCDRLDLIPVLMRSKKAGYVLGTLYARDQEILPLCIDTGAIDSFVFSSALEYLPNDAPCPNPLPFFLEHLQRLQTDKKHSCVLDPIVNLEADWETCNSVAKSEKRFRLLLNLLGCSKHLLLLALNVLTESEHLHAVVHQIAALECKPELPCTFLQELKFSRSMLQLPVCVCKIIAQLGAQVNVVTDDGRTILSHILQSTAVKRDPNLVKLVDILLSHNATITGSKDASKQNLFHWLCSTQHDLISSDIVNVLISHNMDPCERDSRGLTSIELLLLGDYDYHLGNHTLHSLMFLLTAGYDTTVDPLLRVLFLMNPTLLKKPLKCEIQTSYLVKHGNLCYFNYNKAAGKKKAIQLLHGARPGSRSCLASLPQLVIQVVCEHLISLYIARAADICSLGNLLEAKSVFIDEEDLLGDFS